MNKAVEDIRNYLRGKDKAHLKDIYAGVERTPAAIRGALNTSIAKGEQFFERVGSGEYKLKADPGREDAPSA